MWVRSDRSRRAIIVAASVWLGACGTSPQRSETVSGSGGSAALPAAGQSGAAAGITGGNPAGAGAGATASAGTTAPPSAGNGGVPAAAAGSGGASPADAGMPQPDAATDPGNMTLIPHESWHCNLPEGILPPASGEYVFEATFELGATLDLGATQYGMRRVLPITGGAITGPGLEGTVVNGGLEWELTTADGSIEIEARNVVRAQGALIYIRTCGAGTAALGSRVVLDIEAPTASAYAALNQGTYVADRVLDADRMRLRVHKVAAASPMPVPAMLGPADQPWECPMREGPVGTTPVLEASVNIGASLAVGASKYGRRNIIPITGGTFSGDGITGTVISGGADFQLTPSSGSGLQIEARYTIRAQDGELISVRNCGGSGGTRLQFETRAAGPYAFLNADGFTGTIGLRLGGVLISVFK